MRILLVAYEFPPAPSPQSLRWAYLVRELARAGHHVYVLAPQAPHAWSDVSNFGPGVVVHRVFPGPIAALTLLGGRILSGVRNSVPPSKKTSTALHSSAKNSRLNWRGWLAQGSKAMVGRFMFPDVRAEWNPWARRHLRDLLQTFSPQVVISSHEPASTIELGRLAHGLGYPWIVDMGDPVLSSYTPLRWRRHARNVESVVMREADGVLVTTEGTRDLLVARHGVGRARCHVVTQGFDDGVIIGDELPSDIVFDELRLELLYTGRLYAFRRIDWLLEALQDQSVARLTVITPHAPLSLVEAATRFPDRIRVFGPVSHRLVLKLQRECDVLVNIANDDPVHVPGKFYEYLGACKPIIHLRAAKSDAVVDFLEASGLERYVPADAEALSMLLKDLGEGKRNNVTVAPFALGLNRQEYTWRALAARVATICAEVVR